MKPSLSEKERAALMTLGSKKPSEVDPFENHIRAEIGRLSMSIEQGNGKIASLGSDLTEAEAKLTQDIGAFGATARVYLAYVETTKANDPQEAQGEPEPESGPTVPTLVETPQEAPEEVQDGGDSSESEAD